MICTSFPFLRFSSLRLHFLILTLALIGNSLGSRISIGQDSEKPIRALLIAGGCCHDYKGQVRVLSEGIQSRANVRVDVVWTDDASTNPPLPIFDSVDWAKDYDVVIHDECAADNKDLSVMQRILDVHQKIPAVHLHCAMHSFRTGTDRWFKHLGMESNSHGPQEPISIVFSQIDHPICKGLKDWKTGPEELYNNVRRLDAQPLAIGTQQYEVDGVKKVDEAVVVWVNEKHGARSFSTTLGHNTDTVSDDRYLDLVTRGLLWAVGKLDAPQKPYTGKSQVTLMENTNPKESLEPIVPTAPQGATLVQATASSEETGKFNYAWRAFDGDLNTRWCASDGRYPQWIEGEFENPHTIETIRIHWESAVAYQFKLEGSIDGKEWIELLDGSNHNVDQPTDIPLTKKTPVKNFRLHGLGTKKGQWCSIREIVLTGADLGPLFPKLDEETMKNVPGLGADPFQKRGNATPRIVALSSQQEQSILKDIQVADGFEATIFAAPPAVNYPVFVAAAPDGTLYVSSDGNGSLGRDPNRGRVLRLVDNDKDGRADEVKVFCTIDAPRGLVWDRDRLYLMHPPHLSALIDHNGDGIADEQKILVKNLAFGYDKRPADHTTNGLTLGMDGWLYIAGGDFGFLNAEGTDGRVLTHRGGGVLRVRPDGTGLEIYSTGTRNILEVAISPKMDMFARDNTNDGGGWNVRFHHFVGGDDHGYPRKYINFPKEAVAPLADYGGGSGCGAVYLDEPGWGNWNNAPLTADWGTGAIYHHQVKANGATFEETRSPQPLIRMTRPTDADVDANGRLYCASWRGATFGWEGANVGYIIQVRPKANLEKPLPKFESLNEQQLSEQLQSDSYRRRLAAIRELQVRKSPQSDAYLKEMWKQASQPRQLAQELQGNVSADQLIQALSHSDSVVSHVARRELIRRNLGDECLAAIDGNKGPKDLLYQVLGELHQPKIVDSLLDRLAREKASSNRLPILSSLCRLYYQEADWDGTSWGTRPDTRGPYYQPVAWESTNKISAALDTFAQQANADESIHVLHQMRLHRISSEAPLKRLIILAQEDVKQIPVAVKELAASPEVSDTYLGWLETVAKAPKIDSETSKNLIAALGKNGNAESIEYIVSAFQGMDSKDESSILDSVSILAGSNTMYRNYARLLELAGSKSNVTGWYIDSAILRLSVNNDAPGEARAAALEFLQKLWNSPEGKKRLLNAIGKSKHRPSAANVLTALRDSDPSVQALAKEVAERLQVKPIADTTPKLLGMEGEEVIKQVVSLAGDRTLGEVTFAKANCASCHTVDSSQKPRGPFLGNIAKTYKREELARNILDPNRTIAQGFKTEQFVMDDGQIYQGFVTVESAESITIRDIKGTETLLEASEIEQRTKVTTSSMPTALLDTITVLEFASLLDYLESLSK